MKAQITTLAAAAVIATIAIITAARGFSTGAGSFDLSWHTIDAGGGVSTGGAFQLAGTTGQPDASPPLTGGAFQLTGGFWAGDVIPAPNTCPADIAPAPNGDGIVNVSDLLMVINNWGPCPAPPQSCPADIAPQPNGDGVVNVSDLLMVINTWGLCPG